jgi:hypothetical protein
MSSVQVILLRVTPKFARYPNSAIVTFTTTMDKEADWTVDLVHFHGIVPWTDHVDELPISVVLGL